MGQYYHVLMGDELGENKKLYKTGVKMADGKLENAGRKLMEHSYQKYRKTPDFRQGDIRYKNEMVRCHFIFIWNNLLTVV